MRHWLASLGQAQRDIRRNPFVSWVTFGTVAVVYFLVGLLGTLGHNLIGFSERLGSQLRVSVFLKDDVSDAEREAIRTRLQQETGLVELRALSREEGLRIFRERLGQSAEVLDTLPDNPVPASFELSVSLSTQQSGELAALAGSLRALPGVEEVDYGESWLESFLGFVRVAQALGLVVGLLTVLATLAIVSNTIRLSVYARADEIIILKLVGASDAFVKRPFFFQGTLLASLGSALGLGLAWGLFVGLLSGVLLPAGFAGHGIDLVFLPGKAWAVLVGSAALLGWLATSFSLGKYLQT